MTTREVVYAADGLTMVGHLARPDGPGPWPAVLLAHDGIGLDDVQRRWADDLAGHGHLVLALEYHGGRVFSDPDALLARVLPLIADPARMRAVGHAALEVLLAEPGADPARLAGVGLGAGGTILLELARDGVPFRTVAAVHPAVPSGSAEGWSGAGPVLLATGSEDPLCPPDQLLAFTRVLQDAGVDWRLTVHGGAKHAFWHPPVGDDAGNGGFDHAAYHARSDRGLRADVLALLGEHLAT